MIKIIVLALIIFVVYKIYNKNTYENMVGSLVYPNHLPNTNMKFIDSNMPFDIDLMCKNDYQKKYLSWPCWWRENESKYLIEKQNFPKEFDNYLKNTPLKYDGLYNRKCDANYIKCIW